MAWSDYQDLLNLARENFIAGKYALAEPMLKQIMASSANEPEVYQMLATIFYDQGKFNKAIRTFQRALEIDPNYTDASIGLSIILNDIGRYDEGKKVFIEAQNLLDKKQSKMDTFVEEKLAKKHLELAGMYFQYQVYPEAVEQYQKALNLTPKKEDIVLKIADCFVKMEQAHLAIQELKSFLQQNPHATAALMKLGTIYYNANQMVDAVEQWEKVLIRNPDHPEARSYIHLAQKSGVTDLSL